MIIGKILREKRENLEWTQEYVAMKASISQSTYSKVECGKQSITVELFMSLVLILDIKYQDILKIKIYFANRKSIK